MLHQIEFCSKESREDVYSRKSYGLPWLARPLLGRASLWPQKWPNVSGTAVPNLPPRKRYGAPIHPEDFAFRREYLEKPSSGRLRPRRYETRYQRPQTSLYHFELP